MAIDEIIKKITEELKIDVNYENLEEIYNAVKSFIAKVHPDRVFDPNIKKENLEKTKKATEILSIIKSELEKERTKDTSLVLIDENKISVENIEFKLILKEKEIMELKNFVEEQREKIDILNKSLINEREKNRNMKTNEIIKNSKPNGKQYLFTGMMSILTIIFNLFLHIEKISMIFIKYLPFSEKVINIILFSILTISLFYILYKIVRSSTIKKFLDELITQKSISKLNDIVEYGLLSRQSIYDELFARINNLPWYKRLFYKFFDINNLIVIEEGMQKIISYLENNEYIEKSYTGNFNQFYNIKIINKWEINNY